MRHRMVWIHFYNPSGVEGIIFQKMPHYPFIANALAFQCVSALLSLEPVSTIWRPQASPHALHVDFPVLANVTTNSLPSMLTSCCTVDCGFIFRLLFAVDSEIMLSRHNYFHSCAALRSVGDSGITNLLLGDSFPVLFQFT